jgi:hypothetical protein
VTRTGDKDRDSDPARSWSDSGAHWRGTRSTKAEERERGGELEREERKTEVGPNLTVT